MLNVELRIPALLLQELRDALLKDDYRERYAYLECTHPHPDRFCVVAVHPVPDDQHWLSTPIRCQPAPDAELDVIEACLWHDTHPVAIHSHTFEKYASFSSIDEVAMETYGDWFPDLAPELTLGFGVLGCENLRVSFLEEGRFSPVPVTVSGEWTLERPLMPTSVTDETIPGTPVEEPVVDAETYERHLRFLTKDGQHALAEAHVVIVGCGGLGSFLVEEVARLGVTRLTLIDPDRVERSNLPRLLGAWEDDIGEPKVQVAQQQVLRANPSATTTLVFTPVEEAVDQLVDADVIVAGVDRVSTRLWLNQFAIKYQIPYVDTGTQIFVEDETVTGMVGAVQCIVPHVTGCYDCLSRGDMEQARIEQMTETEREESVHRGYLEGTELAPGPAVIHLNGVVASLAVATVSKLVTQYGVPPALLYYDGLENSIEELKAEPSEHCVTCSQDSILIPVRSGLEGDTKVSVAEMDASILASEPVFPPAVSEFFDQVG